MTTADWLGWMTTKPEAPIDRGGRHQEPDDQLDRGHAVVGSDARDEQPQARGEQREEHDDHHQARDGECVPFPSSKNSHTISK